MKRTLTAADKGLRAPDSVRLLLKQKYIQMCVQSCLQQLTGSRRGSRGKSKHFIGNKCNVKKIGFQPHELPRAFTLMYYLCSIYILFRIVLNAKSDTTAQKQSICNEE